MKKAILRPQIDPYEYTKKKLVFIGAGPANIYAILYLLDQGYDGLDIFVIDKGKDPYERNEKDILYGFGGAGFWSDGKYIFSDHPDSISDIVLDKGKYYDFIKSQLIKFKPEGAKIDISSPVDGYKPSNKQLQLRQSFCWHLGTDKNKELGCNMYDFMVSKGVQFHWHLLVEDIDFKSQTIYVNDIVEYPHGLSYEKLQIGLGKTGIKMIKRFIDREKLSIKSSSIHIGGRFETAYNEKIKYVAENIQYDFKYFKKYSEEIELRTFCVNHKAAYVIQEKVKDIDSVERIQYNGHAYKNSPEKVNDLTNFGIIAEVKTPTPLKLQEEIIKDQLNFNHIRIYGPNFSFQPSLKTENSPKNSTEIPFEYPLREIFWDFIHLIDDELHLGGNWVIYFPEIKINFGVLETNEYFEVESIKNVSWVGDSCVGTRGIVPAATSGIKAVEKLK